MDDRCLKHTLLVNLAYSQRAFADAVRALRRLRVRRFSPPLQGLIREPAEVSGVSKATVPGAAGRWHNFLTFLG